MTAELAEVMTNSASANKSPRKRFEGGSNHPGRDQQFKFINAQVRDFQSREQPVISVDAKKKLRHEGPRAEWTRKSETWLSARSASQACAQAV